MTVAIPRDWDENLDVDMVLRAQGADSALVRTRGSSAVEVAREAVSIGRPLLAPVVVSASLSVREFRHEHVRLEPHGYLGGPLIAEHFFAAQYVVVLVCTVGPAVEERASSCFVEDPALSVALDGFGSAAVHLLTSAMCHVVDEQARLQGLWTSLPLSPGLVGWPVKSGQRQLFALLDTASAGISLTDGSMMVPHKSTSSAIGVGKDVLQSGSSCDYCSMAATCSFQQDRVSTHG